MCVRVLVCACEYHVVFVHASVGGLVVGMRIVSSAVLKKPGHRVFSMVGKIAHKRLSFLWRLPFINEYLCVQKMV